MIYPNASTYFDTISIAQYIAVHSIAASIGIFAIASNATVMWAYYKYQQMRQQNCAHLIAALACCDFFAGFGGLAMGLARLRIVLLDYYDFSRLYCIGTSICWLVALEMSQFVTAAIAIDRLRAMTWPVSYANSNHRTFARNSFAVALLAGFTVLTFSFLMVQFEVQPERCTWTMAVTSRSTDAFLSCNMIIGLAVAAFYVIAMYQKKKHTSNRVGESRGGETESVIQAKVTRLVTTLVLFHLVLVELPLLVLYCALKFGDHAIAGSYISPIANTCLSLSSVVNFFLYANSSSNLQPYVSKTMRCGFTSASRRHRAEAC
uniref:G-protein coupled receptors family 1 profile domain-containing protein n=1 Tax=Plectus sambesii TaxID=2011161 RepID=A0A914VCB6_9BILA